MTTAQTNNVDVLMALEGVGNYATGDPTTLTEADAIRAQTFPNPLNTPTFEPRTDPTSLEQGTGIVNVGATNDWSFMAFIQDFTVPITDTTRPPQHIQLRSCTFIETYDNNGGAGPYTLTYTLQSFKDLCDSAMLAFFKRLSDGANSLRETWRGLRATPTLTLTPGRPIQLGGVGKGVDFTGPTGIANIPYPTFDLSPEVRFGPRDSVTLKIVGGSTYTDPSIFTNFEIMGKRNIGETPGGGLDGVGEVTAIATEAIEFKFQMDKQNPSAINARTEMNAGSFVQIDIIQATATAGNSIRIPQLQGMIMGVTDVDVNGREQYEVSCLGVYPDPANPARTPASQLSIVYHTV